MSSYSKNTYCINEKQDDSTYMKVKAVKTKLNYSLRVYIWGKPRRKPKE